jgi:hypothetical protein
MRENTMDAWETYKKWFNAWESSTAQYLEHWLKSPMMLEPAGAMLSAMMRGKANMDKSIAQAWGQVGLPTKRDQERTLHLLNQVSSKLTDLEERLMEMEGRSK